MFSYCKNTFGTNNLYMKQRRLRSEIIDLNTGQKYLNESEASEATGVSRYLIHKSIVRHKICKGVAFASYYYGIDIELMKNMYNIDIRKKRNFEHEKMARRMKKEKEKNING